MIEKIILGTVQLGLNYGINNSTGLPTDTQAIELLDEACRNGITLLDTAADYGSSEQRIGQYQEGSFRIITKFSKQEGIDWKASLERSRKNLQGHPIDTVLFHSFEAYQASLPRLDTLLHEGRGRLFNHIGVSVYTNEELRRLVGDPRIETVQCPFNLLDNESQRGHILTTLKAAGKTIHTRSAFLQGLFFMDPGNLPGKLSPLAPYCKNLKDTADRFDISIGHLALQYALSKPYIDGVLIGVDSREQLRKNLQWIGTPVPPEALAHVDTIHVTETTLLLPATW